MNNVARPHDAVEPPFCWQSKMALRKIREALDAEKAVASGIGVYVALTEIASDEQKNPFETTHLYIGSKSGFSPRTVQERIQDLVEIGVLDCFVPDRRAPATYTLLSLSLDKQPLPDVVNSSHHDQQPLPDVVQRAKKGPLPSVEESIEKSKKNKAKNRNSADLASDSPKATSEAQRLIYLLDLCKNVLGDDEMKKYHARWLARAEDDPDKLDTVLGETRRAKSAGEITTVPARYAEDFWKRMTTHFKCDGCGTVFDDDTDAMSLYECGDCGTQFTRETSADGCSNRCPGCYKFGAKVSDRGCPECGDGELECI